MPHVFVVSPLPAVRAGLRALVGAADDLEVVGEGQTSRQAADTGADVLVIDGDPLADGVLELGDATEPRPGLVILGPISGDERLPAELAGRPWGYVPRDASGEQLVAAVRAVASGLLAIDPLLGGHLLGAPGQAAPGGVDATDDELTARERQVLQLVALGLANKTIARRLSISEHTVKFHVAAILTKLGAASRTEAVHLAARRGLVAL